MVEKMDESDVGRILDNLCSQGNGEAVSIWFWTHVCSGCQYRSCSELVVLQGKLVDLKERDG